MSDPKIAEGQKWRRVKDGRVVVVTSVKNTALEWQKPFHDISWRGVDFSGSGQCFEDSWRRRYELT